MTDKFKLLNEKNVWRQLSALARSKDVYSTHLKGCGPYLNENDVYLYADAKGLLVVCMDACGRREELADYDNLGEKPPQFFTCDSARTSPAWQLSQTLGLIRWKLAEAGLNVYLYGVLLSESNIFNVPDLAYKWKKEAIKVVSGLTDIGKRKIAVNDDRAAIPYQLPSFDLDSMKEVDLARRQDDDASDEEDEEDDEKETATATEKAQPDTNGNEEDDKLFERMIDAFLNEPDSDDDDKPENSTGTNNIIIPDGTIEQNHGVSVNVTILPPLEHPREELDRLVGCGSIRQRMDDLVSLSSYNKMRRNFFPDCKQHAVSLHSLFIGRPGTGKTTVCKIFGSLLHQAGALSKGHVVACDRGTFIGTLWGDEERSVRQVLEKAQGGVLMIDEAYLLNTKNDHDPGHIILQLLMNVLADETHRDLAIVLCGYKKPMEALIESNPGLLSRFPNRFDFPDFSIDELLEITRQRVKEYDYEFTQTAWQRYSQQLATAYEVRNPETWGNARFVANQLERIYIQHATRCVRLHPDDKEQLRIITADDILPFDIPIAKARIGFRQ